MTDPYPKFPENLKRQNQWVCCWKNGKIPMQATARRAASSSDPLTWSSYEAAVDAVSQGRYDNLGYVFAGDVVGIDIDCGFDDGLLTEIGADIIESCGSYTEKSRSGRGVHILLHGKLPFSGKNNGSGVEMYCKSRYFIVTGNQLLHSDLVENQTAIDYVVDKYFSHCKTPSGGFSQRIYTPEFEPIHSTVVSLKPFYPPINAGGRNTTLTSLAGLCIAAGASKEQLVRDLLIANKEACVPHLETSEVLSIADSMWKRR